jgi:ABC-type transporter MlaC component
MNDVAVAQGHPVARQARRTCTFLFLIAALLGFAMTTACSKSSPEEAAEESLESTVDNHRRALRILEANLDNPRAAIAELRKLEENTREKRSSARKKAAEAYKKMTDEDRKKFAVKGKAKRDELAEKFGKALRRYDGAHRRQLRGLLSIITR